MNFKSLLSCFLILALFFSCDAQYHPETLFAKTTQSQQLGTLFSDNFTSLSNWTNVGGGTFTAGGTGLIIGSGATDYNQWIEYNPLPNTVENFVMFMQVEVVSTGILSMGIETVRSVSGAHRKSFMGSWIGGATSGRVVIATYAEGTSTTVSNVADAGSQRNYSVGHILNLSFRREGNQYTCTMLNTSNGLQSATQYTDIPDASPTVVAANNAGKFKIHCVSGSYRVIPGTFSVTSTSFKDIRALFVGDSRTTFMSASPWTNRYANRTFAGSPLKYEVDAGAYDVTSCYSVQQTMIDLYNADYVIIGGLGRNDVYYVIPSATYQTNYTTIRDNAVAGGALVVHLLFPSDASANVTALNLWITLTFPSDIIIDMSGHTFTYSDGVHFTNTDHQYIADQINLAIPTLNFVFFLSLFIRKKEREKFIKNHFKKAD